jgi:hypothetical protein
MVIFFNFYINEKIIFGTIMYLIVLLTTQRSIPLNIVSFKQI